MRHAGGAARAEADGEGDAPDHDTATPSGVIALPLPDPLLALPRLMDVHQVAHRLGFGIEVVRDLIRSGELPAILLRGRWWRVDPRDLDAYIEAGRLAAKTLASKLQLAKRT